MADTEELGSEGGDMAGVVAVGAAAAAGIDFGTGSPGRVEETESPEVVSLSRLLAVAAAVEDDSPGTAGL